MNFSLVLISKLFSYELSAIVSRSVVAVSIIFAIIWLSVSYYRRYKIQSIWILNDNILTRGHPVNTTIDLSTVEKIIIGRPKRKVSDYLFFINFNIYKNELGPSVNDGTLTIKINNKKYLPLYLDSLGNGTEIISLIVDKFGDKLINNYQFSVEEREALKLGSRNKIIELTS